MMVNEFKNALSLLLASLLAVLFVAPVGATIVQIDFNDHPGGETALGGSTTGAGFVASGWNNLSGTSTVFDEELIAPPETNFGLTQSAGDGAARDDTNSFDNGHSTRTLEVPLTGEVWGSFLVRMDSGAARGGIDFNLDGQTAGAPRLLAVADGRFFHSGANTLAPNILTEFVGDGSLGSGDTMLYLFRMDLDAGTWDAWLNPDVTNLRGATTTVGINFTSIDSLGIVSYDNSDTGQGAWVDFVTLSDGPNAYTDVTGAPAPPAAAEWLTDGNGNWSDATNWDTDPQVPLFGQDILFGSALTGGTASINQDEEVSIESITFDNANSYNISGNAIGLVGNAVITAAQGSHEVATELQASGQPVYTFSADAGANLEISGDFVNDNGSDAVRTVEVVLGGDGDGEMSGVFINGVTGDGQVNDIASLRKTGAGTWAITNGSGNPAEQPNGAVVIEDGTLAIEDTQASNQGELAASNITVLAPGVLNVTAFDVYSLQANQSLSGDGTVLATELGLAGDNQVNPGTSAGTLTVDGDLSASDGFAVDGAGFNFELSDETTVGGEVNDLIEVTGTLTFTSSDEGVVINVLPTANSFATGSYRLFNAGSVVGSESDLQLNNTTRYDMSLSTTATQVNLDVSGSSADITWVGDLDSVWDVGFTDNWENNGADFFFNLDAVTFDDSAANKAVDIAEAVRPSSVVINNSAGNDYDIGGAGGIEGGAGITKNGDGRATISSAANSYDGDVLINGGTLHAASNTALGSAVGGTTVANGATLDVGGADLGDEQVTVSGGGVDGQGAITSSAGPPGSFRNLRFVELTGDTTFAAVGAGDRWDIRSIDEDTPATLAGNGHALTKEGAGIVSFADIGETDLGDITINDGALVTQFSTTLGQAGSVIVNQGGELGLFSNDPTRPVPTPSKTIVLNGGALSNSSGGAGSTVNLNIATPIQLNADSTLIARGAGSLSISTPLSGAGVGITKQGGGTVVLAAANTYTGNTVIAEGTLSLGSGSASGGDFNNDGVTDGHDFLTWQRGGSPNGVGPADLAEWEAGFNGGGAAGSIASSPLVDVRSGANFAAGDYNVPNGQTIKGAGTVTGNVVAGAGTVVDPAAAVSGPAPVGIAASFAAHEFAGGRDSERAIDGSNLNFIGQPGQEGDPSQYTHTGGNSNFGVGPNWLGRDEPDQADEGRLWFAVDLGTELDLDAMNFFNFGVSTGTNNLRGIQQGDIYYRSDSLGNNEDGNQTPFDPDGWTLLGTAGTQTFTMGPTDGEAFGPDTIDLSGVQARYIAIDVNSNFDAAAGAFAGIGEVQVFVPIFGDTLTIDGDYTQGAGATLSIDIGGGNAGVSYDVLNVTGEAAIDGGTLEVSLVNSFSPELGDEFDILDFVTSSGSGFDTLDLPTLDVGLDWDASNLLSTGVLSVIAAGANAVPEPSALLLAVVLSAPVLFTRHSAASRQTDA